MSIVAEAPGFLQVLSDGSVKRFAPDIVSASEQEQSSNGYMFKDVVIDPSKPITARIFLPDVTPRSSSNQLLPLLVYFHGGGFCFGSTTWGGYHHFLGDLSVASQSIVVSVDYRLAPEYRLPIAYDDCYSSLEWISHQAISTEPWLARADLSRVFLSGDSAGGNIVHNVAVKAITDAISNVKVRGLLMIHPYFGSEKRTEQEMAEGSAGHVASNDMFWGLSIPQGSNRDYLGCNFEKDEELSATQWYEFPAVMVNVAGLDFLKERGVMYVEFLQKKQVREVKLVESVGESHAFHVFHPQSEATRLLQKQMSEFIKTC